MNHQELIEWMKESERLTNAVVKAVEEHERFHKPKHDDLSKIQPEPFEPDKMDLTTREDEVKE